MNTHQSSNSYFENEQQYVPTSDERTMAILAHLLALVAHILGPLIIYLLKKDESKYVAEHAKESLNFQITMFIAAMISIPLIFFIIGIFMLIAIGICTIVFVIIAAIKASENQIYRYPISWRLIK
jgi:uncharacterized Tic20 family protein